MLLEAARWVDALGVVMWEEGELDRGRIEHEIAARQFVVAESGAEVAGAIRFQLEDALFWPDLPEGRSAFVHRLVVKRAFKGQGVSQALLQWSVERAQSLGREALRLDCDADRPKLRRLYEDFGFVFHSYRQGPTMCRATSCVCLELSDNRLLRAENSSSNSGASPCPGTAVPPGRRSR
jgi:GNAT superfamily N-acetyltransferase